MNYKNKATYRLAKIISKLNLSPEISELLIAWCEGDAFHIIPPVLANFIANEAPTVLLSFMFPEICERRIAEQESELNKLREVASEYYVRDVNQPLIIVPNEHSLVNAENLLKIYTTLNIRGHFRSDRSLQNNKILAGFYSILIKYEFITMTGPAEKFNEKALVQFLNKRYKVKDLQEFRRNRCECEQYILKKIPALNNLIEEKQKNRYKPNKQQS